MTVKTPIRTVFDSSNNATGLAEFQSGEAIGPNHGGTGLTSLGTTGQYLKVNSAATAMEWATLDFASETYVDSAVSNLVDAAPDALNTLNELASALNDDSNFATTINSSIATKLAISDFGTYFDNNLATKNTASLSEGTNLYYTDARVANYLSNNSYATQSYVQSQVETKDNSDEITEGSSNLYFTESRSRQSVSASGSLSYNATTGVISYTTPTTDGIAEGTSNLYYTQTRVNSAFDTRLATKSTDNLSEGSSNQYYTDARVNSYLTNNSYATETYVDSAINNIIDGAPSALDTLNELAEALNDDANFYSSITPTARAAISVAGDLNYNSTTGVVSYNLPSNTATTDEAIALSIALG